MHSMSKHEPLISIQEKAGQETNCLCCSLPSVNGLLHQVDCCSTRSKLKQPLRDNYIHSPHTFARSSSPILHCPAFAHALIAPLYEETSGVNPSTFIPASRSRARCQSPDLTHDPIAVLKLKRSGWKRARDEGVRKIIQGESSTMQHRRFKGRDPMTSTAVIRDAIRWKRSHSKKQELCRGSKSG